MKHVLVGIITMALVGCKKEYVTHSSAFWENKTSHHIVIKGYSDGGVMPEFVDLGPGENFKMGSGSQRGKDYPGFGFDYFVGADSLVVTFDNTYKAVHYFIDTSTPSAKSYLFTSTRNLGNSRSYKKESTQDESTTVTVYTYEFIQEDYQFAL